MFLVPERQPNSKYRKNVQKEKEPTVVTSRMTLCGNIATIRGTSLLVPYIHVLALNYGHFSDLPGRRGAALPAKATMGMCWIFFSISTFFFHF